MNTQIKSPVPITTDKTYTHHDHYNTVTSKKWSDYNDDDELPKLPLIYSYYNKDYKNAWVTVVNTKKKH